MRTGGGTGQDPSVIRTGGGTGQDPSTARTPEGEFVPRASGVECSSLNVNKPVSTNTTADRFLIDEPPEIRRTLGGWLIEG